MKNFSDDEILEMYNLSRAGVSDSRIAKQYGIQAEHVNRLLARVSPDGRVMTSVFGARQNAPDYVAPQRAVALVEAEARIDASAQSFNRIGQEWSR